MKSIVSSMKTRRRPSDSCNKSSKQVS